MPKGKPAFARGLRRNFARNGSVGLRTVSPDRASQGERPTQEGGAMHSIIYLIGLIVVVLAILSFLGLR